MSPKKQVHIFLKRNIKKPPLRGEEIRARARECCASLLVGGGEFLSYCKGFEAVVVLQGAAAALSMLEVEVVPFVTGERRHSRFRSVTGVQTCAPPVSRRCRRPPDRC